MVLPCLHIQSTTIKLSFKAVDTHSSHHLIHQSIQISVLLFKKVFLDVVQASSFSQCILVSSDFQPLLFLSVIHLFYLFPSHHFVYCSQSLSLLSSIMDGAPFLLIFLHRLDLLIQATLRYYFLYSNSFTYSFLQGDHAISSYCFHHVFVEKMSSTLTFLTICMYCVSQSNLFMCCSGDKIVSNYQL